MDFIFIVPLKFVTDLTDLEATVGELAKIELPEVVTQEGFELKHITVTPEEKVDTIISYDPNARAVIYNPTSKSMYEEIYKEGEATIQI